MTMFYTLTSITTYDHYSKSSIDFDEGHLQMHRENKPVLIPSLKCPKNKAALRKYIRFRARIFHTDIHHHT